MLNNKLAHIVTGLLFVVNVFFWPSLALGGTGDSVLAKTLANMTAAEISDLGNDYLKRGSYSADVAPDSALACYTEIVSRNDLDEEKIDPETLVRTLSNIAYIYSNYYSDYREAYSYLMRAEKVVAEHDLEKIAISVTGDMSFLVSSCLLFNVENSDCVEKTEANRLLLKTLSQSIEEKMYQQGAYALYNILDVNFPDNDNIISQSIALYRKLPYDGNNPGLKRYIDALIVGIECFYDRKYKEAAKQFESALDLSKRASELQGNYLFEMFSLWLLSMIDETQGNFRGCESKLQEIDSKVSADGSLEMKLAVARMFYHFYIRTGNEKAAERNLLEFFTVREKIYSRSKIYSVADMRIKGELNEIRDQVYILRENRRKMRYTVTTIIIVSFMLIAGLVGGLIYYRKRQSLVMELYKKNLELINEGHRTPVVDVDKVDDETGNHLESGSDKIKELSDSDRKLLSRIDNIINCSDEVFDPEFSLDRLCEILDSNTSYVSRAINIGFGKPFKTLLSERRVFEACCLIDNDSSGKNFSIEGIGLHVGYKSRVTFTRAFKSVTGLTPSAYKKASRRNLLNDKLHITSDDL